MSTKTNDTERVSGSTIFASPGGVALSAEGRSFREKLPERIRNPDPRVYLRGNGVCVDFEVSGGRGGGSSLYPQNRIILACWMENAGISQESDRLDGGRSRVHVLWGGEYELKPLQEAIRKADFVIAHHAKYEIGWLARAGNSLEDLFGFCTQIGEWVLDPTSPRGLSLDAVARRYGLRGKRPVVDALLRGDVDPADIPHSLLEERCTSDVLQTVAVFREQVKRLDSLRLLPVTYCRNLVTPVLVDIESEGMQLDNERVRTEGQDVLRRIGEIEAAIQSFTGGVNFRSGKQMGKYLYETLGFEEPRDFRGNTVKTDGGQPKTDEATILALKVSNENQRRFKELISEALPLKQLGIFYTKASKCLEENRGLLTANFNQTNTDTGRLSSTGGEYRIQFQNPPIAVKRVFKAKRDGWLIGEGDARQLEFRCAGDMARDPAVLDLILSGGDVHALTAEVMKLGRHDAKPETFKPLYGGNSGSPKHKAYYKAFRKRYRQTYDEQSRWVTEVLKTGQLRIPSGLIFKWKGTEVTRSGYIKNSSQIFNYPIQSFATADIIPLTLVLVWWYIRSRRIRIVNTQHDSIIVELDPEEKDFFQEAFRQALTEDVLDLIQILYNYKFVTPLGVEGKFGLFWGEDGEGKFQDEGRCREDYRPTVARQNVL